MGASGKASEDRLHTPSNWLITALPILLLAYSVIRLSLTARAAPFWYDEIVTHAVAAQTSLTGAMRALLDGVDSHTPFFYLIEFYALRLFKNEEFALRLPSVLAFAIALVCVFTYAKRRWTDLSALGCAVCLLATSAFQRYATEARAYSLLLAFIALALVCYDRLQSRIWNIGLGLSLLLAEAVHYYAIFSILPFIFAELGHIWLTRSVRWKVWAAIACPIVPLVVTWRFLAAIRRAYGGHFWVHSGLEAVPVSYGELLSVGPLMGGVIAMIFIAVQGWDVFLSWRRKSASNTAEAILRIGLLLLPLTSVFVTILLHVPMISRYVIAAALAVALVIGSFRVAPKSIGVIVFSFLAFNVGISEAMFWNSIGSPLAAQQTALTESFIRSAGHPELPVVVAHGLAFLPLARYGSPELQSRLAYVVDVQKALEYSRTDSIDENLIRLRRYTVVRATDLSEFARDHPEFLLFTRKLKPDLDWLTPYLAKTARSMEVLAESGDGKVYHVCM
jgi:Dolichyl-phosphate-mannose-protein mannosyltransferase